MEDFAAILVAAREQTGLTQAQVAVKAGLTPSYLSFIENRKKPPPSDRVCRRLAEVLGIPARRLLDVAHMQRAPETVQRRVRSLRHSLKRERHSKKKLLESLLSPFLFAGPPGYLESALDSLGISAGRRKRLRQALAALGRHRQDRAEEVAALVDGLSESDRNLLLDAIPHLLRRSSEPRRPVAGKSGDPPAAESGVASRPAAGASTGTGAPPLWYVVPPRDQLPPGPYLLEVAPECRPAPEVGARPGDFLLVDPAVTPEKGDLLVLRRDECMVLAYLERRRTGFELRAASAPASPLEPPVGTGRHSEGQASPGARPRGDLRRESQGGARAEAASAQPTAAWLPAGLDPKSLEHYLSEACAGVVVEVRRRLRRGPGRPGATGG